VVTVAECEQQGGVKQGKKRDSLVTTMKNDGSHLKKKKEQQQTWVEPPSDN